MFLFRQVFQFAKKKKKKMTDKSDSEVRQRKGMVSLSLQKFLCAL